eukprot:tig00021521_g22065.t1
MHRSSPLALSSVPRATRNALIGTAPRSTSQEAYADAGSFICMTAPPRRRGRTPDALHVAVNGEAVQGSPLCWTVARERAGRSTPALRQPLGASLALVQSGSGPHASATQRALLCAALQRADAAARPPRTLLLAAVCTPLDSLKAATVSLLRFVGSARGLEPDVFICTPRRASEMTLGADPALGVERGWARGFEGADEDGCPHAVAMYAFADALRTFAVSLTPEDIAAGARCVLVLLSDGRRLAPEHFEPRLEALVSLMPQLPPPLLPRHRPRRGRAFPHPIPYPPRNLFDRVPQDRVFLETVQDDICGPARLGAYVALPTGDSSEETLEVALATIAADAGLAARYCDAELKLPFPVGGQPAGARVKRARAVTFGPDGDAFAAFWIEGAEEYAALQACENWDWSLSLVDQTGDGRPLVATGRVSRLSVDARCLVQLLAIQRLEHRLREICADVGARAAAALAPGAPPDAVALPDAVRSKWVKECAQMEGAVKPYAAARQPFAPELRVLMRASIAAVRAAQGAWGDPDALRAAGRAARTLAALAPPAARFLGTRRAARDRSGAAPAPPPP